jgi:hypothetical protein
VIGLGVVAFVAIILFARHRVSRKATLAGLDSDRPAFHIEPPGGRVRRASKETL